MSKALIINADDFGYDDDTVTTTINLFNNGLITSATIMTDMPGTGRAVNYAVEHQHMYSFGLHFNIVDGHLPCEPKVSTLLDRNEVGFKKSNLQRIDSLLWRLNKSDIQKEFIYQLSVLFDLGLKVSHIDSHGHLHKFPQILDAIRPIMKKYGINTIRIPQNYYQVHNFRKALFNYVFKFSFHGLATTDKFFMLENHLDNKWFDFFIKNMKNGVTELGIHPGTVEDWRLVETKPFFETSIKSKINNYGIDLINYNSINEE
jgi:predicted glycoside hydrolase/deacetylase ChbG (UPF0249 family)